MRVVLATISGQVKRIPEGVEGYLKRASVYEPSEWMCFPDEEALLSAVERAAGRTATALILFDSRGKLETSEGFAEGLRRLRDGGRQRVMLAIGPASGWSERARSRADEVLSLGRMTLPHALAQVVVAEQIYRALTILAGHPYHCGH